MHYFPAYKFVTLAVTALSLNSVSVNAAPQNQNTNSLTSKVQAYLRSQGVNATIPASAQSYGGSSNTTSFTCGILKAYRNSDLVTPLDGAEYVNEAEQHWYVDIILPPTEIIQLSLYLLICLYQGHPLLGNTPAVSSSQPQSQRCSSPWDFWLSLVQPMP